MAEVAVNATRDDQAERRLAAAAQCLRCSADLSRLPMGGRYCPRCGLDSYCSPPAALRTRASEWSHVGNGDGLGWTHLAELTGAHSAIAPPTVIPSPDSSSEILRGYANALYKLGRRYETAVGHRNPREAIRCYLKAARLSNMMAFARLATRWIERCDRNSPAAKPAVTPFQGAETPLN